MIPARGRVLARFVRELDGRQSTRHEDVVAWTDDGEPLVVGDHGLEPARQYADFAGLVEADTYIAAVPGQGWRARLRCTDGTRVEVPVVAWLVTPEGGGIALVAEDGLLEPAGRHVEDVFHPDSPDLDLPPATEWRVA